MIQVKVAGLDQLGRALEALPQKIARNHLRKAIMSGVVLIKNDAIARVPVRTGALRDAIMVVRDRNPQRSGATERYMVGVRKIRKTRKVAKVLRILRRAGKTVNLLGDAYYWRYIEFGTSKMAAQPFMRPAFEAEKGPALDAFVASLRDALPKAVEEAKS